MPAIFLSLHFSVRSDPGMFLFGDILIGEDLTRWTIRLALLGYLASVALQLAGGMPAAARVIWTVGCIGYLMHVACAFHFFHDWSHDHAYRHTAGQTSAVTGWNWGGGLYVNYAFTLVWMADVFCWWLASRSYVAQPRGIVLALHAFFLFIIFNATVVFGTGAIRWWGVAGFVVLAGVAWTYGVAGAKRPIREADRSDTRTPLGRG